MHLEGTYVYSQNPVKAAKVLFYGNKTDREVVLYNEDGTVLSAYKRTGDTQFMAVSDMAAKLTVRINRALSKVKKSGGDATTYNDIPAMEFYSKTRTEEVVVISDRKIVFKITIDYDVQLEVVLDGINEAIYKPPKDIKYVALSGPTNVGDGKEVVVRTVEEIKLTKTDLKWLETVDYQVVQDDEAAEQIFSYLDNYKGGIAYDTETTGLRINCFGKINSTYKKALDEYNDQHPEAPLRADRLCGIIFCVEPFKAYYFPCFSRKFDVLFDKDTPTKRKLVENIKAKYTVGELRDKQGDMADYIRSGGELTPDIILMERVRNILENGYIVAHNGSFEWKCGMLYDINTKIRDDTMLLHQVLYRYGPNPAHRFSNLKYLSKLELGVDQWGLEDFFPSYKEDDDTRLRADSQVGQKKRKKKSNIDFSYMELDGTHIYAPADGDCTFRLWQKYKADLKNNWIQMEKIYLVEISVCPAMAYCEFYGHRFDENKIESTKQDYVQQVALLESMVRSEAKMCTPEEDALREKLNDIRKCLADTHKELDGISKKAADDSEDGKRRNLLKGSVEALTQESGLLAQELRNLLDTDVFNINSQKQMCSLFYDTLGIPETSRGRSMDKAAIKALLEHKNEDGSIKYPIVKYFQQYKATETLLSKFFDNLQDYMYPGGYIFSSYGQIAAATGRMSCKSPNCIAEGTLVTLMGEQKLIEQVKVGDLVYCYDDDKQLRIKPVVAVYDQGVKDCIEVEWRAKGKNVCGVLRCTPEHKIRREDGVWVRADSLKYGDRIAYLHIGVHTDKRPNLYGWGRLEMREQDFIRKEYFKCDDGRNYVVHHKDEDKYNNKPDNVELMTRKEHGVLHATKQYVKDGDARLGLYQYTHGHTGMRGNEHPLYIDKSADELIQMLRGAGGNLTKVHMDFGTFKRKCEVKGVDYKSISEECKYWGSTSPADFVEAFMSCGGKVSELCRKLGMTRGKVEHRINKLGLVCNHRIISVTHIGKKRVYDLEVEDCHNFIAGELNVHNCQQYPKAISKIVIPRPNCVMLCSDYSQIEYRVLVALAKQENLLESFKNFDNDYHTLMASIMYGVDYAAVTPSMRSEAKGFNFGIPYGMGIGSLAMRLYGENTPKTREKAKQKRVQYFRDQPNVERFFERVKEAAVVYGYTETAFKRRRYYTFTSSNSEKANAAKAAAQRQAGNAVIQGCIRGDTRIYTVEFGYTEIQDIVNSTITVWDGYCYSRACVMASGDKAECKITLSDDTEIYCSPEHKFEAVTPDGRKRWMTASDIIRDVATGVRVRLSCSENDDWKLNAHITVKESELVSGDICVLDVKCAEETGRIVPMFDVVNSETKRFMANGIVTHNSAADIFKIAIGRCFKYIVQNDLLGKVFLTNYVHDEILFEIDVTKVHTLVAACDIVDRMSFSLDGYPPLFVGPGVSDAWAKAKSKECELHPDLVVQLKEKAKEFELNKPTGTPEKWVRWFDKQVLEFRHKRIIEYLQDESNFGQAIHPEIGSLIRLLYNDKISEDGIDPKDAGADAERTLRCVEYISDEFKLNLDRNNYISTGVATVADEIDEHDYEDDENTGEDDGVNFADSDFEILEDNKLAGVRLQDLICEFGYVVAPTLKVCGIDDSVLTQKKREEVYSYLLDNKQCDKDDEGALQLVLHLGAGVLKYTEAYVRDLGVGAELEEMVNN